MSRPPRLLTIAGSDSGGGAGIQADLKTFASFGGYGMSVVTAVTAQNTRQVTAVHEVPAEVVEAQIAAVASDIGVDAVKVGILASVSLVQSVADALRQWLPEIPLVVDPVMVSKSGAPLLAEDAVEALKTSVLPLATVVTPNLPETTRLTGLAAGSEAEREAAARRIRDLAGGAAVLVKGGHGEGDEIVDLLLAEEELHRFRHPRVETSSTHGTGCTLSSAITAGLGAGIGLAESVGRAVKYLHQAVEAAFPVGSGHGPVNHLHEDCPLRRTALP